MKSTRVNNSRNNTALTFVSKNHSVHTKTLAVAGLLIGLCVYISNVVVAANPTTHSAEITNASYTASPLSSGTFRYGFEGAIIDQDIHNATVTYTVTQARDQIWNLDITLSGVPDSSTFSSASEMDERGSIATDRQYSGKTVETTSVRTEKVEFVGSSKIITWERGQEGGEKENGKPKECMISADEIVTTLLQLPVWAGTVRNLSTKDGVSFRWCIQGDPMPMKMVRDNSPDPNTVVYACRKIDYTDSLKNEKTQPTLIRMIFDKERLDKGFAMPEKITIQSDHISLSIVERKNQ